jgi:hypothetical protein
LNGGATKVDNFPSGANGKRVFAVLLNRGAAVIFNH